MNGFPEGARTGLSVRNLLWGCPTWFLANFFCPTCPTHLSHQSVPRLFPNWVDRTELGGCDGRFIRTAWNKRTRKIEKTQVTPPHNPEVGGSSPPPATRNPLESPDSSGLFLFLATFLRGLFRTFKSDPDSDPYGDFSGLDRAINCRRGCFPWPPPPAAAPPWSRGHRYPG